ncbi:MAG: cyclic nucleotide-binding/CBS domain-containing protein [Nitrosopumilaceae archaeon]
MDADTKKIRVKNIMSKGVLSVDAKMNVNEAAKMMEDGEVGAIIVMENNTPVGIITDRDFAVKIVAHAYPITTPVKKIMSAPLIGINPEESVWTVADLMYTRKVRKIPVIDEDKVVGIVTATDLVNQFAVSTEEDLKNMYYQSIAKIFVQEHYV